MTAIYGQVMLKYGPYLDVIQQRLIATAKFNYLFKLSFLFFNRIPGRLNDRRTPLGELNWIFTAITDTIAWNVLPRGRSCSNKPKLVTIVW